jgi:protease-4
MPPHSPAPAAGGVRPAAAVETSGGAAPAAGVDGQPWPAVMERFARDYLNDRRSERRWRILFRLAWLLLVLLVAWAVLATRPHVTSPTGPHPRYQIAIGSATSGERREPAAG